MRCNAVCKSIVLLAVLILTVAGCTRQPVDVPNYAGHIRVSVGPPSSDSASARPKAIPQEATNVRIRVWHEDTGFNAVATVEIGGEDSVDIPVPEDEGYTVDAVSYYVKEQRALALTGGRAHDVSVSANEVTTVQIQLSDWHTDVVGDTIVEPETGFELTLYPSDGGGLLSLQTFREATLHTSTEAFDDADDALPLYPGTLGILSDDRIAFTSIAPDVSELTVLFAAALVEFALTWRDTALSDRSEHSLFIELPNRHTGEDLYQITIDPTSGGLVVEITGTDH